MYKTFSNIYKKDIWNHTNIDDTSIDAKFKSQIKYINNILAKEEPDLIIDIGCGNNQFILHTDIPSYDYRGIDIVPEQIAENKLKYPNNEYIAMNSLEYLESLTPVEIPSNTIFFIKDVFQHWDNDDILKAMLEIQRLKSRVIIIFKGRGAWRCKTGVKCPEERDLNNKYHEYPLSYDIEPLSLFTKNRVSALSTNSGYKKNVFYDFSI